MFDWQIVDLFLLLQQHYCSNRMSFTFIFKTAGLKTGVLYFLKTLGGPKHLGSGNYNVLSIFLCLKGSSAVIVFSEQDNN